MKTVTDNAEEGSTKPRPGFENPESARIAAIIFAAGGIGGADIRRHMHPEDRLLAELADAVDALAAEGLDKAACQAIVSADEATGGNH